MPKAMKKSSPEQSTPPAEVHESVDTKAETLSSDQEQDPEISFCPVLPSHSTLPCSCLTLKDPK